MDNPGIKDLGDFPISGAGTYTGDSVTGLEGMLAACLSIRLAYGTGGTSIKAYLQTSLDQGTTWVDIACVVYATVSESGILNFSALTPKTTVLTPTDAAMADDTAVDGVLGDRFRLKYVVTGTYATSTVLSARVAVR